MSFNKRMLVFLGIDTCKDNPQHIEFCTSILVDVVELNCVPLNAVIYPNGNPEFIRDVNANLMMGADVVVYNPFEAFDPYYLKLAQKLGKPIVSNPDELLGFQKSWMRENGVNAYPDVPITLAKPQTKVQPVPKQDNFGLSPLYDLFTHIFGQQPQPTTTMKPVVGHPNGEKAKESIR